MTSDRLHALRSNIAPALGLMAVLAVCWLVYQPGLKGAFLLDDFSNLSHLGDFGRIDNRESLRLYLLSGFAGPTGRPLSMLAFLLDARDWPADPARFKRTNLIIHLITGTVLFALARQLAGALGRRRREAGWIALLTAALWLLHPFWVSTTLYAVQRMAQLSGLFVLLGLWLYVRTRVKYPPRLSPALVTDSSLAIGLAGLLAVLAKENGALLPPLAIVLEVTVLQAHDRSRGPAPSRAFSWWRLLLLGVPTLSLCGYLLAGIGPLLAEDPGMRDFTPGERLLTEGRVLWDYVAHILLPRPYSGGLFNDDIQISRGLLQPWTTALAWASWAVLTVWAWRARSKHPALALAILFFLTAHVLESSFLQLELYYEHRSYLPAALAGFPLAIWWTRHRVRPWTRRAVALGALSILAGMTAVRADLWGRPFAQALKWAQINPESSRAQHYLAEKWRQTGNFAEAERRNKKAMALAPKSLLPTAQSIAFACQQGEPAGQAVQRFEQILSNKRAIGAVDKYYLAQVLDFLLDGSCGRSGGPKSVLSLIRRLESRPNASRNGGYASLLAQRAGVAYLRHGDPKAALDRFRESARLAPAPGRQLKNAAILATHKAYAEALTLIDEMDSTNRHAPREGPAWARLFDDATKEYFERERAILRQRIARDYHEETSMSSNPLAKPIHPGL